MAIGLPTSSSDVRSLEGRRVLCDLFSAQASVLERNVSAEVAGRWRRTAIGDVEATAALVRRRLPEPGDGAVEFCVQVVMMAGTVRGPRSLSSGLRGEGVTESEELVAGDVLVHGAGVRGRLRHRPEGSVTVPGLSRGACRWTACTP
ncbi:hypothetical protein [Streptomyces sennicomposti]